MLAVSKSLGLSRSTLARHCSVNKTSRAKRGWRKFCTETTKSENVASSAAKQTTAINSDQRMLITTSSFLYGRKIIREIALVSGSSVRAKNVLFDLLSRFSGFFGWEVTFYGSLLSETSSQAVERMIAEAAALGADAIIDVKFTMSSTSDPTAGVFVYTMTYGTAVITEPHEKDVNPHEANLELVKTRLSKMPNNPL